MQLKKTKIVIDTDLWISFIITAKQEELVTFLTDFNIVVYTCNEMLFELDDVLNRSKIRKYLSGQPKDYIRLHKQVAIKKKIRLKTFHSADPKDNYLIDLGLTTNSSYLVTGDKQLLSLKNIATLKIVTFAEFKGNFKLE